ncbi:MAG: DUF4115 domain-containing protein [Endomicrobia bacterium]|nr:DUF4115 domain-containing protein [Endomicrobiia bacterium]
MKEIGKILREKREKLGLNFDKVHRVTRIQEKYILAIEEGDESVFSAEVYYKSFVKSYAKFLGLSGEELLAQYEKRKNLQSGDEEGEKPAQTCGYKTNPDAKTAKAKSSDERKSDLKKLFITVLIAGILCAAFLYLNKNISIFIDDSPGRIPALEQKKILHEQKEQEQREQLRLREIAFEARKNAEEESKNRILKPENVSSQAQPDIKPVAAQAPAATQAGNNTAAASYVKRQELEIVAVENVWIKVDSDGREIFQGTIVKGDKKNWKADNEFTVKIGYTPGVNVYFNGIKVDVNKGAVQDVNTLVLKRQQ